MAHKQVGNKVVVDWTTGDPEGDRITLLAAYRDFIKEIKSHSIFQVTLNGNLDLKRILDRWSIDTENQIDDVPRIWIKRPEL
jgi:hypothetical protein